MRSGIIFIRITFHLIQEPSAISGFHSASLLIQADILQHDDSYLYIIIDNASLNLHLNHLFTSPFYNSHDSKRRPSIKYTWDFMK